MRILIAEDERLTRMKLHRQLEKMGHEVVDAADGEEAWELFEKDPFSIVISDWEMPRLNGVELVRRIRSFESPNYVYIVMLTGKSDKKDVVEGIEAGADDFVSKPFDRDELNARLSAGLRIVDLEHNLANANDRLRHELAVARELSDVEHRKHEESLLGNSIAIRALREGIQMHAESDVPLLLCGPEGAGHEAVARAIHRNSTRRSRAFIYVSCPNISVSNESIYGFQMNDGQESRSGKTSLANGGTLYLEGVEALSENAQKQLTAFLQASGADRESGRRPDPDVRVIAQVSTKSGADPEGLIDELQVLIQQNRLTVPSLAERQDDIPVMANRIVQRRARSFGKTLEGFAPDALGKLKAYSWPGNIRELGNVIERSVLLAAGALLDVPDELLREGRRVGGYTLQTRLGEGGMGEVWLAQHALLARPSAVKLIRKSSFRGDAQARDMLEERFQREAEATSQLRSPHTVELYDFGVTDEGDFYYVMEFLSGVDLNSLVGKFGPVSPARAVCLLSQACTSLGEAHLHGLVHRDVKPENLFVCQLGTEYDFLKLLDFGIVRTAKEEDESATSVGVIKGTPVCMSPEAAQSKEVTFASDIYSLGCVAYWLLTGKHVFEAPSVMTLLLKHVSEQPKPPSEFNPDVPPELDELVLHCLKKDPLERPRDANELGLLISALTIEPVWDNFQASEWWNEHLADATPSHSGTQTTLDVRPDTKPALLTDHATDVELWNWCRGELDALKAAAVEEHLESCDACAKQLELVTERNQSNDAFTDRVRGVMAGESNTGSGELTETMAEPSGSAVTPSKEKDHWAGRGLGEFEVVKTLGVGHFGVVLKARDTSLQRDVAIKVLSQTLYEDEVALKRFSAEAQTAGKFDHPNIVTIYKIVREGQLCYLVMEYVPGGSTQHQIERYGAYSAADATQIVLQACRGLGAAHLQGLIHRDIRPSNLLLTKEGTVKVSDFGLSKQTDALARQLTLAGQIVGEANYISPEQCESGPVDARADVYSLGATYYSLLTGQRPYDLPDPVQVLLAQRNEDPPDPRSIRSTIPDVCAQIIEQAMAKRPDERYQSMNELQSDLEAILATVTGVRID